MTERLLDFCDALVGRFRGGLAQVNVVQSIIFAGMSGSAIADAAGTGKMMQNMMTKDGKYTPSFAAALTAVTAVIGPIIPPSIPMVLYALVSDTSIGYLFLGGVVPGLLMALVQMVHRRRSPRAARTSRSRRRCRCARCPRITWRGAPGAADAGGAAGRHLWRRHHADRGRGGRRRLCAASISVVLYRSVSVRELLSLAAGQRRDHRLDRHADRRRAGLQLRRDGREHPATSLQRHPARLGPVADRRS